MRWWRRFRWGGPASFRAAPTPAPTTACARYRIREMGQDGVLGPAVFVDGKFGRPIPHRFRTDGTVYEVTAEALDG